MWLNRHANLHKYKHVLVRESILLSKYVYYHIIIIDVAQPTCAPIPMSTYDHHSIYIFISKWPYLYYYIVSVYTTLTIFILLYRMVILLYILSHIDMTIHKYEHVWVYMPITLCVYIHIETTERTHTRTRTNTRTFIFILGRNNGHTHQVTPPTRFPPHTPYPRLHGLH